MTSSYLGFKRTIECCRVERTLYKRLKEEARRRIRRWVVLIDARDDGDLVQGRDEGGAKCSQSGYL